MSTATVHLIAAARPNFMKVAPLYHALKAESWCRPVLIHTGQHYDANMSDDFIRDFGLPDPDYHLEVGSGTHAEQTAGVMVAYEKLCNEARPDWTVVVGDVNSTLACTLAAVKLGIPVAHLEAGLRSFDRTMPEEINRVVTDSLADLLWTPSADADENLKREGIAAEKIVRVGNIMIDSFEMMRGKIEKAAMPEKIGLKAGRFGLVTLHRPSNVDTKPALTHVMDALAAVAKTLPLVFPVHPRTRERLRQFGLEDALRSNPNFRLLEPLGYVEFMSLLSRSALAMTDSGGIQEETTYLGIPCLTLRTTTERPITVSQGTNRLVRVDDLAELAEAALKAPRSAAKKPDLWDGHTAARVARSLKSAAEQGERKSA